MIKLKDYKTKVRSILKDHEAARNNDGVLIARFISKYCKHLTRMDEEGNRAIPLKNIEHLPPFESIRRSRQIIQNDDGEFLPTKSAVIKARKIKEENMRNSEVREAKKQVTFKEVDGYRVAVYV